MSTAIAYTVPPIPVLLTISSFIYILNVAEYLFSSFVNAGLIGSLLVGIIYGPEASDILPGYIQSTFIILGYIGLLLLVFEAGLSTNVTQIYSNFVLSSIVAVSGIAFPIGISVLLLRYGYGYTSIQAFGSGVALCSTSLGTTLTLLSPELRQTRTGVILLSAALLDDITGLIFAAIIPNLPYDGSNSSGVNWFTIVRPILSSIAFGMGAPLAAIVMRRVVPTLPPLWVKRLYTNQAQTLFIITVLIGFVAGAHYAGTSELFGAYLAGAFLNHTFPSPIGVTDSISPLPDNLSSPVFAFMLHLHPLLHRFLSPMFFASIGIAIPIRSLFIVKGSRRVIWRGILYSLLMVLGKAAAGLWIFIWPDTASRDGWCCSKRLRTSSARVSPANSFESLEQRNDSSESRLTRTKSAALIGLAMVARGEIALIIAQLAQPLLVGDAPLGPHETSEPFAVVIWAILVTTVGGALGVGWLLRSWGH
ncbi:hypothetical protein H0H87_002115 [Tephrocybe sp. NHM501043]|nr:hypothetical protein H0H87_002115 [Tephrocybe sp. NHM501043]